MYIALKTVIYPPTLFESRHKPIIFIIYITFLAVKKVMLRILKLKNNSSQLGIRPCYFNLAINRYDECMFQLIIIRKKGY